MSPMLHKRILMGIVVGDIGWVCVECISCCHDEGPRVGGVVGCVYVQWQYQVWQLVRCKQVVINMMKTRIRQGML